jgi:hypothetical protein
MALDTKNSALGIDLPIRPFSRDELDLTFEELAEGEVNYDAVDREYVFKEEVINALKHHRDYLIQIEKQVIGLAVQKLTITADDLSTSTTSAGTPWKSATNDLLTVRSQTSTEFDYRDFWKTGKFVLSPGKGVPPHIIIPALDLEYPGLLPNKEALYAYDATVLQLVEWSDVNSRWEAKSWAVGWTVWHWLFGPKEIDI